jgi:hypothetical protein
MDELRESPINLVDQGLVELVLPTGDPCDDVSL